MTATDDHDTETMARLYLDQGKVREAAAIYRRLLDRAAGDAERIHELGGLLEQARASGREARRRAAAAPAAPPRHDVDVVALVPQGAQVLYVWQVTARGRAGAARQLGGAAGELCLRVATALPGAARTLRDLHLPEDAGEGTLDAPPEGGYLCAAVGLRAADGAFAAIAHAEICVVASTRPAPASPPVLVEVAPEEDGPQAGPRERGPVRR